MSIQVTPPIGAKGLFDLSAPFDQFIDKGEEYTCQGIRRIRDYVAANEDVKELVYVNYGIEATYEEDYLKDEVIISLQSRKGHWLYVPQRYVVSYPSGNGHEYRACSLVFALPSLPVNMDLDTIRSEIQSYITGRLGVDCVSRVVETSKEVLVSDAVHNTSEVNRNLRKSIATPFVEINRLNSVVTALQNKLAAVENFIVENHPA